MRKHRNAGAEAAQSMIKATGGHAIGGATRQGVFCRIRIFCQDEMIDLISLKIIISIIKIDSIVHKGQLTLSKN